MRDTMQAGDVANFTFTVTDRITGAPVNLGQYSSVQVMFAPPGPAAVAIPIAPALVGGGTGGVCTCQSAAGQFAAAGTWRAQVVGLQAGIEVAHSSVYLFDVAENIA